VLVARIRDALLVLIIPLTFALVTPWNNLDGNNPAKFLILVSFGTIIFSLSLTQSAQKLQSRNIDKFQIVGLVAVVLIIISSFTNRYAIDERLFGIFGRSLGAITFIVVFLLAIASAALNSKAMKFFNYGIVFSLVLVSSYFAIQLAGLDPAAWEDAYSGVPSSSLGNPNFVSSSLAILSVPVLAILLFRTRLGLLIQLSALPVIVAICFLIWKTQSLQGLLIIAFSTMALLILRINELVLGKLTALIRVLTFMAVASIPAVTFLVAFGFVPSVGGGSLLARTDYWRSAWNLILDNPMFGKGFDSFGDWYFFYRDQLAIERSPGLFTDSTHNLILELGVFGGLPLLLAYLALQALTLRSALKVVTSMGNLQAKIVVVAWIGFHLQSAISPSGLALITLGFVLTGVVYGAGQSINSETGDRQEQKQSNSKNRKSGAATKFVTSTIALVIAGTGSYLSTVPIVKDARFRDAIEQGDGQKMIDVSRQWPFNYQLSRQTARTLKSNGYDDLAREMVNDLIKTNPFNIQGWRMLFEYSTSKADRSRALAKMKELDPLNPELAKLAP